MIQAVLFDLDGLIIDTEPIHFAAFRGFMQQHGLELPESVMPRLVGFNEYDNIRLLKEEYHLAPPLEELVLERRAIYAQLLETEPIIVFPGFWEITAEAHQRGLKQGVVSSSQRAQVVAPLRRLFAESGTAVPAVQDPTQYFSVIVSGDEADRPKPAPDLYLLAQERLGLSGEQCLAFEDTPAGVTSAAAAGVMVYAVPNQYTRELDFPGARGVLGSLHEGLVLLGESEVKA